MPSSRTRYSNPGWARCDASPAVRGTREQVEIDQAAVPRCQRGWGVLVWLSAGRPRIKICVWCASRLTTVVRADARDGEFYIWQGARVDRVGDPIDVGPLAAAGCPCPCPSGRLVWVDTVDAAPQNST